MIRKQVYLEERHERMLKRRAKQRGVTEAEIIRQALDGIESSALRAPRAPDAAAGRKALEFMRSLGERRRKRRTGRDWTRESLYEDRIGRWRRS